MKTTKIYLSGCVWCNATGFVPTNDYGMNTTPQTEMCPVCQGKKVIQIIETTEDDK